MIIRKTLKLAATCCIAISAVSIIPSCSSDPNPVDYIQFVKGDATIQLNLSVAGTRADADATPEEIKVSKVSVYIFDSNGKLETVKQNLDVKNGIIDKIETTSGLKTIYAVSAISPISAATGMSITEFEASLFSATQAYLRTTEGFVMIGKTGPQNVVKSASAETMPASNSFTITLERTVAKVQVNCYLPYVSGTQFLFDSKVFSVRQTAKKMQVTANASDIKYDGSADNGTCAGYDFAEIPGYISAQLEENPDKKFTADNCLYMSENIVETPKTGNTTFVSFRTTVSLYSYYEYPDMWYDKNPSLKTDQYQARNGTFYAVGLVDRENGFIDYAVRSDHNNNIVCFINESDANKYAGYLNKNEVQAMTVSETEEQMKSVRAAIGTRAAGQYEVLTFVDGYVYYRINIRHTDALGQQYKVCRNNYYKIDISSIKTLGFPSEAFLRPTKPDTPLDLKPSYWLGASFKVSDWNDIEQPTEL